MPSKNLPAEHEKSGFPKSAVFSFLTLGREGASKNREVCCGVRIFFASLLRMRCCVETACGVHIIWFGGRKKIRGARRIVKRYVLWPHVARLSKDISRLEVPSPALTWLVSVVGRRWRTLLARKIPKIFYESLPRSWWSHIPRGTCVAYCNAAKR